jgi:hypothetical protein
MNARRHLALIVCLLPFVACGSSQKPVPATGSDRPDALGGDVKGSGGGRCSATAAGREISEYDTSGDGRPDVRKVYLNAGVGVEARLVMICRETDVNGDGKKDVIRYYDDEGRSLREESDRNFDGKMDVALVFQDGKVAVKEIDENHDGKIDTKIFMDNGKPLRAERDLKGRSTQNHWQPDRWEYYEAGQMVRMGTDLDGDERVDRWDRDLEFKAAKDAEQAKAEAAAEGEGDGMSDIDGAAGAGATGASGAGGSGGSGGSAEAAGGSGGTVAATPSSKKPATGSKK